MRISGLLPSRAAGADGPNVLFFFADDQRADTIHALGNPVIQTPNLDRLVRRGVSFRRAYMQGGMQGATCVPSNRSKRLHIAVTRFDQTDRLS